jgi:photosystem II stability/assembly factor-like uncharacterized protein
VLLLLACVLAAALAAPAGASWFAVGPEGGTVFALAVDPAVPATLYAGTDGGGVWKSSDAGASWSVTGPGIGNLQTLALAIDPQTPSTLYAGTVAGAFKSNDGGASWTAVNNGLTEPVILQLAIDPLHSATLYAGTLSGLFASTDGAASWKAVAGPFDSANLLALDPLHPETLYVAPLNAPGLYESMDGGASWKDESAALGGSAVTAVALALDPASPARLYTAVRRLFNNVPSFFSSPDGGTSWTPAGRGLEGRVILGMAAAPRSTALYAATDLGIYTSTDGGKTFKKVGPTAPAGSIYAVALAGNTGNTANTDKSGRQPGAIYAGSLDLGVWKSADGGRSFKATNHGLLAVAVLDLALSPGAPSTVYVRSLGSQIWRSSDGGNSFVAASRLPNLSDQGLAVDPAHPAVVYAGVHGYILKSTAGGTAWTRSTSLGNMDSGVVTVDPQNSANVYLAGQPSELRDPHCAAFRSQDAGGSWICMTPLGPQVEDLAIAPSAPATLYAVTIFGLQKSTDYGVSWALANHGLEQVAPLVLAVDSGTPSTVYAAAEMGLWKTTDGGDSWGPTGDGLPVAPPKGLVRLTGLAVDPGASRVVYVVASIYASRTDPPRLRVFRSTDGAATFTLWSDGLPRVSDASRLVVDSRHPGTVYLGTYGRGVYRAVP